MTTNLTWNDVANTLIDWEQAGDVANHRAIIRAAYFMNLMVLYEWREPNGIHANENGIVFKWTGSPDVQITQNGVFSSNLGPDGSWFMPQDFNLYAFWDKFKKEHGR